MKVIKKITLSFIFFCISSIVATERPLHVLFVVEYFPSSSQIYILNMITGLIDRGHKVSIFSFRKSTDFPIHPDVKKYGLLNLVMYEKFPQSLPDCDIVFCQFGGLGKVLLDMPKLSSWLQQRKMVVCLRGFDVMEYVKNSPYSNYHLFQKIDLFLPVCAYFKRRFIALGCPPEKVIVHHSAINCSQFFFKARKKPKQGLINIIFVGRLVRKKGIPYAIKAIAEVLKKYKDVRLTIIGEGPERENLERLIRRLKLDKQYVRLVGWKSQDEIVAYFNRSHIFLLPSVTPSNGNEEGIANALKEAMAMGLISIATWHAGTPELIMDGVSGFLVPEKNIPALARVINYTIEHPEQWESIGQAARKKIEDEFECKKLAQELETIFYTLIDTSPKIDKTDIQEIIQVEATDMQEQEVQEEVAEEIGYEEQENYEEITDDIPLIREEEEVHDIV